MHPIAFSENEPFAQKSAEMSPSDFTQKAMIIHGTKA
jgi:hypothetical protein